MLDKQKNNQIGDDAYGGKEIDWNLKERAEVNDKETTAPWDRQFKNPQILKEASQLPLEESTPHVKKKPKQQLAARVYTAPAFLIWTFERQKKYPTIPKVMTGDTQAGIWIPNASASMMTPSAQIEYIAPFFK